MKIADFYKAEKLIKQHEKLKHITEGFRNSKNTVTVSLKYLEPETIKKIETFFDSLQKDLENQLDKI